MNTVSEITIAAARAAGGARYDAEAKALFRNPEIIAPVLKEVVREYQGYSASEVIGFIQRDSISDEAVDDVSVMADQLETEMSSVSDKLIRYDARFTAINPRLTTEKMLIYLHIDLEIQNDYKPGNPSYPIIKRGIYYAAREISSQLGVLTEKTDYGALEKVYSIWICSDNIPAIERNSVSVYSIGKDDPAGVSDEPDSDYDLMDVIIIRRGKSEQDGDRPIFDYLNGVFNSDIDKVNQYVDISQNTEVLEGVSRMSGLGESIYIRGMEQGMQQGMQQGIQQGMQQGMQQGLRQGVLRTMISLARDGLLDMKEAARRTEMSEEEFAALVNDSSQK